jgi:EAL domain-containing protein (putative c-di-GMP-specific phosphodiesterase class I)
MIEEFLDNSNEQLLLADLERVRKTEGRNQFYICYLSFDRAAWFSQRRDIFESFSLAVAKFAFDNQGKFFKLHNFDVGVLLRLESGRMVERAQVRLGSILQSMSQTLGMSGTAIDAGTHWFQCEAEFDQALDRAKKASAILDELMTRRNRLLKKAQKTGGGENELGAFDPTLLAEIERNLARANIDSFIRSQPICSVKPGSLPVPLFREVYVSMEQLRRQFSPNADLLSAPTLFHHLAKTIDQRVLRAISGGFIGANFGPFSLNLTLHTILSPLFREFDERAGQLVGRNQLVIEVQRYDMFWDFTEFKIACEFLRANGYRVLLDGVTPNVLKLFISMGVQPDYIKMFVNRDEMEDWRNPEYVKLIRDYSSIIINARCSNDQEGGIAAAAGIELFQGWVIDEAIKNKSAVSFMM